MKKILITILMSISFILCACGSQNEEVEESEVQDTKVEESVDNESEESEDTSYQDSLELTMWTFYGDEMTGDEVPTVLGTEEETVMQFPVEAFNYDSSYFVYIYINDDLVAKEQYSDISTSVDITEKYLKEGEYTVRFVQYDNNEENGNVLSEKTARYKVEM